MEAPIITKLGRDDRRAAILDIAYAAFLADGYAATSMSTIAARVGGSKATLYHHFASKEALFAAVIADRCEQLQSMLFNAQVEGGDFRSALQSFGERFLQLLLQEQSIATYRLVMAESARFPEIGAIFYKSGLQQGRKRLGEYFSRAIEQGFLRPGDATLMAHYYFDLCMSGIHVRALWNVVPNPGPDEIHDNVARAIAIFLAAFGGSKLDQSDATAICSL